MAYCLIERTERVGFVSDAARKVSGTCVIRRWSSADASARVSGEAGTLSEVAPGCIVADHDSYFDMRTQRGDGDLGDENFFDLKDAGIVIHLY